MLNPWEWIKIDDKLLNIFNKTRINMNDSYHNIFQLKKSLFCHSRLKQKKKHANFLSDLFLFLFSLSLFQLYKQSLLQMEKKNHWHFYFVYFSFFVQSKQIPTMSRCRRFFSSQISTLCAKFFLYPLFSSVQLINCHKITNDPYVHEIFIKIKFSSLFFFKSFYLKQFHWK